MPDTVNWDPEPIYNGCGSWTFEAQIFLHRWAALSRGGISHKEGLKLAPKQGIKEFVFTYMNTKRSSTLNVLLSSIHQSACGFIILHFLTQPLPPCEAFQIPPTSWWWWWVSSLTFSFWKHTGSELPHTPCLPHSNYKWSQHTNVAAPSLSLLLSLSPLFSLFFSL